MCGTNFRYPTCVNTARAHMTHQPVHDIVTSIALSFNHQVAGRSGVQPAHMIIDGTRLVVSDNSGAKEVECIKHKGRYAAIGDIITCAIKKGVRNSKVSPVSDDSLGGLGGGHPGGRRRPNLCRAHHAAHEIIHACICF